VRERNVNIIIIGLSSSIRLVSTTTVSSNTATVLKKEPVSSSIHGNTKSGNGNSITERQRERDKGRDGGREKERLKERDREGETERENASLKSKYVKKTVLVFGSGNEAINRLISCFNGVLSDYYYTNLQPSINTNHANTKLQQLQQHQQHGVNNAGEEEDQDSRRQLEELQDPSSDSNPIPNITLFTHSLTTIPSSSSFDSNSPISPNFPFTKKNNTTANISSFFPKLTRIIQNTLFDPSNDNHYKDDKGRFYDLILCCLDTDVHEERLLSHRIYEGAKKNRIWVLLIILIHYSLLVLSKQLFIFARVPKLTPFLVKTMSPTHSCLPLTPVSHPTHCSSLSPLSSLQSKKKYTLKKYIHLDQLRRPSTTLRLLFHGRACHWPALTLPLHKRLHAPSRHASQENSHCGLTRGKATCGWYTRRQGPEGRFG
jgi:hypothetical protein